MAALAQVLQRVPVGVEVEVRAQLKVVRQLRMERQTLAVEVEVRRGLTDKPGTAVPASSSFLLFLIAVGAARVRPRRQAFPPRQAEP